MFRRLPVSAVLALALLAGCGSRDAIPRNLLFVIFDTTRADHLGCYGYRQRATSPVLDQLARSGTRLAQVYAQSSLTPVSAASFLTGAEPWRHGVRSLFVVAGESLSDQVPALAESLSAAGLRTAGFVSARPMGSHYGLDRGFETWDDDLSATKERYGLTRFADAPQRPGDETAERALAWLDQHGREPFACLVHFFDAHDPSFVPPRDWLAPRLSFELPPDLGRRWSYEGVGDLSRLVELYDAEIAWTDEQLGRLLAKLEELGVRGDTLVVVLADHGESFGEHGYFTHGWLSEEELRVPVVLSGPGVPAGRTVSARLRSMDLPATLAEAFDCPLAAPDGRSAWSLVQGGREDEPRQVYAEVHHAPGDPRGREPATFALIDGPWKYLHHPTTGRHELYRLDRDPGEARNLFADESRRAARMAAELLRRGALGGPAVRLDGMTSEQLDELRALGYLGQGTGGD